MSKKSWPKDEAAAIVKEAKQCETLGELESLHEARWHTGRTRLALKAKLHDSGQGGFGKFLKARRLSDKPLEVRVKKLVNILKRKRDSGMTDIELCDILNCPPKELKELIRCGRAIGHTIDEPTTGHIELLRSAPQVDRLAVHNLPIEPIQDEIRFAVMADQHHASLLNRNVCAVDFVDHAYHDFGIRNILEVGDGFAGINMYPGQRNEIETASMEGQVQIAAKRRPKRKGLVVHAIGGNHDESFWKVAGADPFVRLCGDIVTDKRPAAKRARAISLRPDIRYYGFYSALLNLIPPGRKTGIKAEMYHPERAGAYALSYHMQREIEQTPPGMKPQMFFCGHRHQGLFIPDYRGVHGFDCCSFEDQTLYLKRKRKQPTIGGWMFQVGITKDGSIRRVIFHMLTYYHSRRGPLVHKDIETDGEIRFDRSWGIPGAGE